MKILVNGVQYEAYNLILTKENAAAIVSGKKRLESRCFSAFYQKMFLNINNFNRFITRLNNGLQPYTDTAHPIFKKPFLPTDAPEKRMAVHFTNRQHSWFLDVLLKEQFVEFLTAESVEKLGEEFDFHDFDYLLPELARLKDTDKVANNFFFVIDKVLQTNL
jgi:hypothetical protein